LHERLAGQTFDRVFTSPLQRAARTCALAGLGDRAVLDPDLLEWDYGDYEGRTSREIQANRPGWQIFRDGCPHGETAADVGERVDRVIARLRAVEDRAILFSSAHVLRVLTARWLELPPDGGRLFALSTASISVLGYEHDSRDEPVVTLWNEV
jgi:probable phosphoglycerate mutase